MNEPEISQLLGGTLRIQHGTPTEPVTPESNGRSGHQNLRYESSSGEYTSLGSRIHQVANEVPSNPRSVAATLKNIGSQGPSCELIPGNPSSRCGVAVALRDGLIELRDGRYVDVARTGPDVRTPAADTGTEAAAEDRPFAFVSESDTVAMNEDLAGLAPHSVEAAMARGVAAITSGNDLSRVSNLLALDNQMQPAEAAAVVAKFEAVLTGNLTRDLVGAGLVTHENAPAFYDYVSSHPQIERALSELLVQGKTTHFKTLAASWRAKQ